MITNNYRTISLTSVPCKMMEHIVLHYMYQKQNDFLHMCGIGAGVKVVDSSLLMGFNFPQKLQFLIGSLSKGLSLCFMCSDQLIKYRMPHGFPWTNSLLLNDTHIRQHGFRRGVSCETLLCATFHELARTAEAKKTTHAVVLDFKKAFGKLLCWCRNWNKYLTCTRSW